MSKNTPSKVGRTYGQLKVVEYLGNGLYDCECSCGNHRQVLTTNLRNDKKGVFRCENCQKEYLKNIKRDKKVGQRYDMLEVKEYLGNRKYKCLCDCGNYTEVITALLRNGSVSSCGCLAKLNRCIDIINQKFNKENCFLFLYSFLKMFQN